MIKALKNKKGFTLTELIIVIVIIGILAAVLIPSLSNYIQKAKKSAAEQDARTIYNENISTILDVDGLEEYYSELSTLNYVVETGNYYVLIEKGAVTTSFKKGDAEYTVDTTAAQADLAISDVTTDKYLLIAKDGKFVKASEDGKLFNGKLVTITKA